MTGPIIKKPKNVKVSKGKTTTQLIFDTKFQRKWQGQYSHAQKYIDSEVIRESEPYTPLLQGILIKSAVLGSDVGSGEVQWIVPYAKRQYYAKRAPGSKTGPLRGPYWFERMKVVRGKKIVAGARRIAGRGAKQ